MAKSDRRLTKLEYQKALAKGALKVGGRLVDLENPVYIKYTVKTGYRNKGRFIKHALQHKFDEMKSKRSITSFIVIDYKLYIVETVK